MLTIFGLSFGLLRRTGADQWRPWLVIASIAFVFVINFICELPGLLSFVLIPVSLILYLIVGVLIVSLSGILLEKKHWRAATSSLLALVAPISLWVPINWAADYAHLGLTAEFGAGQIGSNAKPDGSRFQVYDWSTGMVGGPNTFLIQDPSDEIALPLARHKHPASSENGFGEDCAGRVKHLLGHYYVCSF